MAQTSTTSLGANSPKASSRLSGESDDPISPLLHIVDTKKGYPGSVERKHEYFIF